MKLKNLRTSLREITFGKLLKNHHNLLLFGALCNLIAKMHNASKFWSIKFMDANFLYYSIYDRFIQRQPCACVCKLFLLKNFSETFY